MKKIILAILIFSFFTINTSFALRIAPPVVKLEYKIQNRIENIFNNIEKKISTKSITSKEAVYDKIILKIQSLYNKYPNLSWKSLDIIKYIEDKAIEKKNLLKVWEDFIIKDVFDWIYEEDKVIDATISEWVYILWNIDAKISFIEYSDIECPFCARLHNNWTVEDILEKYDWKVNFIFKHFPLAFHKKALTLANAAECAWEQWWSAKYYEFISSAFTNTSKLYWEYFISDLVNELWINKTKFDSCLKSEKYNDKISKQMKEGSEIWVTWTPWNVIMNNETWEYKLVPWAYPTSHFVEVIDEMLK